VRRNDNVVWKKGVFVKRMISMWRNILILSLACMLISNTALAAALSGRANPGETLRFYVDQVIDILDASQQEDVSRKNQDEKIWEAALSLFDFDLIAKLALGRNRRLFSPEQLQQFTDLFSDLLKRTYVEKLKGEYQNSNITIHYEGQDYLNPSKTRAVVRTLILRDDIETPIDYSMRLQDGKWHVYDIKVENVSLIQNYREQFDDILFKHSPEHLMKRLKDKLEA
jgi:phospholipid transport system substrate-binding protein